MLGKLRISRGLRAIRCVFFPFRITLPILLWRKKRKGESAPRNESDRIYEYIGRAFRVRGLGERERGRKREGQEEGRKEERDRMERIERPFTGEIRDRYQNGVARERRVLYGDPSSGFYDGVTPP